MGLSCASETAAQTSWSADCRTPGLLFHQLESVECVGCPDAAVQGGSYKPELWHQRYQHALAY